MKNKLFFSFALLVISQYVYSQNILISTGGTVTVNGGETFYDAGGPAGNDGNTNYTITLCPPSNTQRVALDFGTFKTMYLDNPFGSPEEDALFIYNGNSTSAPNIGKLMGDYTGTFNNGTTPYRVGSSAVSADMPDVLRPTIFSSTASNGCLTLSFVNTSSNQYSGWQADVIVFEDVYTPGCNINLVSDSTNLCSGNSTTLTATGLINNAPINNNFNDGTVGTGWLATSSATFTSNVCSSPSLDNSIYLWMQNAAAPRSLTTNDMDVSNGGTISFEYRQAADNGSASPCESPDRNSGGRLEGVYVQYSIDGGTTWNTMKFIFPNGQTGSFGAEYALNGCGDYTKSWTKMTYPIPSVAQTANTRFRWIQGVATSSSTDNWGLDNIVISTPYTSTLTITDLSTNTVIANTNSNTVSVNVYPTATTTYRATISNGIDSCTQDFTVNVSNCSGCASSQTMIWD